MTNCDFIAVRRPFNDYQLSIFNLKFLIQNTFLQDSPVKVRLQSVNEFWKIET